MVLPPLCRARLALAIACAAGACFTCSPARAADPPSSTPAKKTVAPGDVIGCDHFAFLRASMPHSLGGPAKQALKSWDGEMGGTFALDGTYYQLDVNNSTILRIKDDVTRIVAGTGVRGWRDGPADQAQFDLGVGSYSDADIRPDSAGNLYISEAMVGRIRKLYKKPDGQWWVETISGGGTKLLVKGVPIPAREAKVGSAARIAVTPDGVIYFCNHEGIACVKEGTITLLVDSKSLRADLGDKAHIADWHVGGSHITKEQVFYWMPGGGPDMFRCDLKTGKAERFTGFGKVVQYLDGPTLRESSFHTVLMAYYDDGRTIYSSGGDESIPRRIQNGLVTTLRKDGSLRQWDPKEQVKGAPDPRWKEMAAVQCVDAQGRLYIFTGDYGWGGWIVRFTFADAAPTAKKE